MDCFPLFGTLLESSLKSIEIHIAVTIGVTKWGYIFSAMGLQTPVFAPPHRDEKTPEILRIAPKIGFVEIGNCPI